MALGIGANSIFSWSYRGLSAHWPVRNGSTHRSFTARCTNGADYTIILPELQILSQRNQVFSG